MVSSVLRSFDIVADHDLEVMRPQQTLTSVTCDVLRGLEPVLRAERPHIVLVQGDTTTTFAASLAAFYARVPVAHTEAGLRTGDLSAPYPEEGNRRLTGTLASWHLAPTSLARDNLLREGVPGASILVTGNTAIDAVRLVATRIRGNASLRRQMEAQFSPWLPRVRRLGKKLLLVTSHRRESFGSPLASICEAVRNLSLRPDTELVYPVHPNPNVRHVVHGRLANCKNIHLIAPVNYAEFVYLMMQSHLILTDSGGIQEEAPSLGKPVLVLRNVTERPEGVAVGVARLVGTDEHSIVAAAAAVLDDESLYNSMLHAGNPYGDGLASARIESALRRWMDVRDERLHNHRGSRLLDNAGLTVR